MNERAVVEAALFSAGRPLSVAELARATRFGEETVREHVRALSREYAKRDGAIEIAQIGTKWTMQIRQDLAERSRAFAPPEIDRDLLKTAALIAYHQPVLLSDLFDMVGSKVYEHTKALEELGLIARKPSGRSLSLTTTRHFAEFFGLKSTDREGIRKLMARKAGVPYTERTEPSAEVPATDEPIGEGAAEPPGASPHPVPTTDG